MAFITLKNIARETLPRLVDNLVMPNLCWNDFSEDYTDLGDTIQVKKPVKLTANDFTVGSTVSTESISESSVDIKMDKIATVDVDINALEAAHSMNPEKYITDFIEPAAVALAEKINKTGLEMYRYIPNITGTAGTTPSALTVFTAGRKFLNKAKAPTNERFAIWDTEADAKFTEISNFVKVNEAGTPSALREGQIGRVMGLDNYWTQGIEAHTGTATGTVLVDGAITKGDTKFHFDGLTAAFSEGDTFTIAGDTTVYTVYKAGDLDTADQDVYVVPAATKNFADNAAVTPVTTATTNNLVFHKTGIAFVSRPLSLPQGVDAYVTNYNGISLRVVRDYDMSTKKEKLAMDVLYNYAVINPDLCLRYLG